VSGSSFHASPTELDDELDPVRRRSHCPVVVLDYRYVRSGAHTARTNPDDLVPVVTADVFERGSGVPASLQRLGARVAIEHLVAGDYRVGHAALIERKTVADLHGSLGRGRLWEQIGKVRDEAVTPFLLIEGGELDAGPRHPNAIRGALLAIAELGVTILWSRDPADSALWLHRLAVRQARKANARSRPRRTSNVIEPGIDVLAAIPGISTQTARALLSRFGSIDRLLGAGPERWAEVEGVGAVRAHALATALLDAPGRIPARR
jgi:ERCC4-type nuclease